MRTEIDWEFGYVYFDSDTYILIRGRLQSGHSRDKARAPNFIIVSYVVSYCCERSKKHTKQAAKLELEIKTNNFVLKDFLIQLHRNSTLSNQTVGGQFYCPPCTAGTNYCRDIKIQYRDNSSSLLYSKQGGQHTTNTETRNIRTNEIPPTQMEHNQYREQRTATHTRMWTVNVRARV